MRWRARESLARHPVNGGDGRNVATAGAMAPWWGRGRTLVLLALVAGASVAAALRWRDPHVLGAWGYCPSLLVTGTPCPTCGGLRAMADLTGGRLDAAWGYHPYLVASVAAGMLALVLLPILRRFPPFARFTPSARFPGLTRFRDPNRWVATWWWRGFVLWVMGLMVFGVVRAVNPAWWPPGMA